MSNLTSSTPLTEAGVTAELARGPHAFVDVDGGRIATWKFGRGPDVVLVHGWPLHGATFRRIVPLLADAFTLHVLDLLGTGKTEWPAAAPVSIPGHARVVRGVVDALGLRRYALFGHDSGGAVARMVAAGDARVQGVALLGTEIPGHTPFIIRLLVVMSKIPGGIDLMLKGMRIGAVRRSSLGFGECFTDPRTVDGEFGELFVRPLQRPEVARGQVALIRGFTPGELDQLEEVHRRIAAKTLCVWGSEDRIFPVALARTMLPQFAGGAELVEIPGAKLFAHEDHPREVVGAIRPFLTACFHDGADAPRAASLAS